MAMLPDGRVVSGSDDRTLRVWDASSGVCERVVQSTDADVASLNPSGRDGHSLFAKAVALGHSGPLLVTSTARIYASERLTASNAVDSIAAPALVGGAQSGSLFFMTVASAC